MRFVLGWLFTCCILGILPVQAQTPPPLEVCTLDELQAAAADLRLYQPTDTTGFVEVSGDQFTLNGAPFTPRGINYYPARSPWRRFLTETSLEDVDRELALLQSAGLNTLRIFLWNEALFTCPGNGAIPVAERFHLLDGIIHTAASRGFRLIVTLNDLPDLEYYPLYSNPAHIQAQTSFIIYRYRHEAAIMAWDVRNEGDIDYGTHAAFPAKFPRETVIAWLEQTADQIRAIDSHHLLTAGWLYDAESTEPYVDFVSFHHWGGSAELLQRIDALTRVTPKPVLVQEFGYSTFNRDPQSQAHAISEVIAAAEASAAGWLIWAAFDFPLDATCIRPACPSADNAEHHFGLWYSDYTPKPVAQQLLNGDWD